MPQSAPVGTIERRCVVELSGSAAPSEFVLLKSGLNPCEGGDLLFDAAAATSVMATYQKRGIQLMADYEHQSLVHPPIVAPASAKKWIPELRNGDLVAGNIAWTDRAAKMITDGEYRFFSIACRVDPKTNRVMSVINFGLTNNPAANQLQPLVAASITHAGDGEEIVTMSKTVLVALGLNADLDESAAVLEAAKLADLRREVYSITGKSSLAEAMGVIRAQAASHDQVVALTAQVAASNAEKRALEFDALVKAGSDAKKLSPALAASEWIKSLRGKEDGALQLRSFLDAAPALVDTSVKTEIREASAPGQYSADEVRIATVFARANASWTGTIEGPDGSRVSVADSVAKRLEEVSAANIRAEQIRKGI